MIHYLSTIHPTSHKLQYFKLLSEMLKLDQLTPPLSSKPSSPPLFFLRECNMHRLNFQNFNMTPGTVPILVKVTVSEGESDGQEAHLT